MFVAGHFLPGWISEKKLDDVYMYILQFDEDGILEGLFRHKIEHKAWARQLPNLIPNV